MKYNKFYLAALLSLLIGCGADNPIEVNAVTEIKADSPYFPKKMERYDDGRMIHCYIYEEIEKGSLYAMKQYSGNDLFCDGTDGTLTSESTFKFIEDSKELVLRRVDIWGSEAQFRNTYCAVDYFNKKGMKYKTISFSYKNELIECDPELDEISSVTHTEYKNLTVMQNKKEVCDEGPDGVWETEDDRVCILMTSEWEGNNRKETISSLEVGFDGIVGTADDRQSPMITINTYSLQGYLHESRFQHVLNDEISLLVIYSRDGQNSLTEVTEYISAGEDGDWFTLADNRITKRIIY